MLADKNGGQTLTFVMIGVCGLGFAGIGLYSIVEGIRANDTTKILGGAGMLAALIPLLLALFRRQRNAG